MVIVAACKLFIKGWLHRDEYARFMFVEAIARRLYPRYIFGDFGRRYLYDEEFRRYYAKYVGGCWTYDRKYALDQFMRLVSELEGDTAECGVYLGASSYLICRRIRETNRHHHIFDSFEGVSAPGVHDGSWWHRGDLAVPESVVRETLKEFDFVEYHKGWIPERFFEVADKKFCFVHVDVDLYEPTRECIAFFYYRLVPGGILLLDDYDFITCPGATRAVDDFMQSMPEPVLRLPTGQGLVIKSGGTVGDGGRPFSSQ